MIERTQLSFPVQLQADVRLLLNKLEEAHSPVFDEHPLWGDGEVGLSYRTRMSHTNEDNKFGDIDTFGSKGIYPNAHGQVPMTDWKLCKSAQGTLIEAFYQSIQRLTNEPYSTGRVRIVRVEPGQAQALRTETGFVYHFAVQTNPHALFLVTTGDGSPKRMREGNLPTVRTYNVAEDGHAYILDGTKYHGIMNAGHTPVIHLVVETDRVPRAKPKWTGQTAERLTGNHNVLEQELPGSTMFQSEF